MIVYFFIISGIYLYYQYGYSFAKGMSIYISENNRRNSINREDTWKVMLHETEELFEAMANLDFVGVILEFGDVCNCVMKHIMITYFPECVASYILVWLLFFPFILPTSIKVGHRYNTYKCIRNHQNIGNLNHNCNYKNKRLF